MPIAKEYIRRLVNAGYKGTFSIEHHSSKHEYERVAWQLATVRELITELEEEGFDNPVTGDYFSGIYGVTPKTGEPKKDPNLEYIFRDKK